HARFADGFLEFAFPVKGAVAHAYLAVVLQRIVRGDVRVVLRFVPHRQPGDLEPGAQVAGQVDGGDGGGFVAGSVHSRSLQGGWREDRALAMKRGCWRTGSVQATPDARRSTAYTYRDSFVSIFIDSRSSRSARSLRALLIEAQQSEGTLTLKSRMCASAAVVSTQPSPAMPVTTTWPIPSWPSSTSSGEAK